MPDSKIIVALDSSDVHTALTLAKQLDPSLCRVKVGKELFTKAGPTVLTGLHELGHQVFLDLKFHDIPNTVAKAVEVAADLGVWMVNVHASGGRRMMDAAKNMLAKREGSVPLLIAVTVLTSSDQQDLQDVGINVSVEEHVKRLAKLTQECGLDGVVCSAQEALVLRQIVPKNFKLITPGIRPEGANQGDQKRVCTPAEAIANGVDYLVIGRPITQSNNPFEALKNIAQSIAQ